MTKVYTQLNVHLGPDEKQRLLDAAKSNNLSMRELITKAVELFMANKQQEVGN